MESPADPVRIPRIVADLVELGDRKVVVEPPRLGAVERGRDPSVTSQDQVIGVRRVDPQRVVIEVDVAGSVAGEGPAPVVRAHEVLAADINAFRIVRIHPNHAEVHGPGVGARELLPGVAAVPRGVDARLPPAGLDGREDQVTVPPVDVEPDAPEIALREAVLEALPVGTSVHGAVHAASGAAPIEAPCRPLTLVHGRDEGVRVGGIHDQIDGSGLVVHEEHQIPGGAAVCGLIDATLGARHPQVADRRHISDVRVARMHADPGDVAGLLQAQAGPGTPPVHGLEDAVPPRGALAVLRLAGSHPHHVRVRRGEGDVSD